MGDDFEVVGRIVVNSSGAAALDGLNSKLDGMGEKTNALSGITSAFGNVASFVWGQLIFKGIEMATQAIGGFVSGIMTAGENAQNVQAQLNAVIKSTGDVSGVTAAAVNAYSEKMAGLTKFDDEAITGAQNLLLTFTSIGKQVFPDATTAILDMSQAMGQDLQSTTIQVGKALNDPIKSITALHRVGVEFTQGQKDSIKAMVAASDTMGAQKVILAELTKEFGGSAVAAGKTFAGSMAILGHSMEELQVKIFNAVLPSLTSVGQRLVDVFNDPAIQKGIQFLIDQIGIILPYVLQFILGPIDSFLAEIDSGTSIVQAFADQLGPIGTIFMDIYNALSDLLSGNFTGFFKNMEKAISDLWNMLIDFFTKTDWKEVLKELGDTLLKAIGIIWQAFVDSFGNTNIGDAIKNALGGAGAAIISALQGLADLITNFTKMVDWKGLSRDLARGINSIDWTAVGSAFKDGLGPLMKAAGNLIIALADAFGIIISQIDWGALLGAIGHAFASFIAGGLGMNWDESINGWKNFFTGLGNTASNIQSGMKAAWEKAQTDFVDFWAKLILKAIQGGKDLIQKIKDTLQSWVDAFNDKLSTIQQSISDAITGWIQSVENSVQDVYNAGVDFVTGLLNGIKDEWDTLVSALQSLVSALPDVIKKILGISSPSKIGIELGANFTGGFGEGMFKELDRVQARLAYAMRTMAPTVAAAAGGAGGTSNIYNNGGNSHSVRNMHLGPVVNNYIGARQNPNEAVQQFRKVGPG